MDIDLNPQNIIRYLVMFTVVTVSTKIIPTCGVLQNHAIYVGLISASTLALLDMCYPNYVRINESE
jgi:exosortase/archaeosortase|tara:strand:+ start:738 stop:935 length:198 start_codon:yes stop_codon:yes gene_type:complete